MVLIERFNPEDKNGEDTATIAESIRGCGHISNHHNFCLKRQFKGTTNMAIRQISIAKK